MFFRKLFVFSQIIYIGPVRVQFTSPNSPWSTEGPGKRSGLPLVLLETHVFSLAPSYCANTKELLGGVHPDMGPHEAKYRIYEIHHRMPV